MPSPFPGMDPFIESLDWPDFHGSVIFSIRDLLVPCIRPRYFVRTEERVYFMHDLQEDRSRHIRPDVLIADTGSRAKQSERGAAPGVLEPVSLTLPMPEEVTERYLTIRKLDTSEVVTVIEVLSPANKRAGSYDRAHYLAKRDEVLFTQTSLVELDLMRGGQRLPFEEPLPPGDYYAFVSRGGRRPRSEAYSWTLRQPLPRLPIPLGEGDSDVVLDLQEAFTKAYDSAGYDYSLDYKAEVEPRLPASEAAWLRDVLRPPSGV